MSKSKSKFEFGKLRKRLLGAASALVIAAVPMVADAQGMLLRGIGGAFSSGGSVTFDTSLGASLSGEGFYGTLASLTSQGTDTKAATFSAWIYCSNDRNATAQASGRKCLNGLILNGIENSPNVPGGGTGCEGANPPQSPLTTIWAPGPCLAIDNSSALLQLSFNGQYGANATNGGVFTGDSNTIDGDGVAAHGWNSSGWHQLVYTISTDTSLACNSGSPRACWDVLFDGVSQKSNFSLRYWGDNTLINLLGANGLLFWNAYPGSIGGWVKQVYVSNRFLGDSTTGNIPSTTINKLWNAGGAVSLGSGNCRGVDGADPLMCLVGNGPSMFTTNLGSLTGLSYQARAVNYTGTTRNLPITLHDVATPPTAPGATAPSGPYMRWPVQGNDNVASRASYTTGFGTNDKPTAAGLPVSIGDAIGFVVLFLDPGAIVEHSPTCPSAEDGVAWTQNVTHDTTDGSSGGYPVEILLCTRTATTTDTTVDTVYNPTWSNGAPGRSLQWYMFDYTNTTGGFGNIALGAPASAGNIPIPALAVSAGSVEISLAFIGAYQVPLKQPTGDTLRAGGYQLGSNAMFDISDIGGLSAGTQSAKAMTYISTPVSSGGGIGLAIEVKQ